MIYLAWLTSFIVRHSRYFISVFTQTVFSCVAASVGPVSGHSVSEPGWRVQSCDIFQGSSAKDVNGHLRGVDIVRHSVRQRSQVVLDVKR